MKIILIIWILFLWGQLLAGPDNVRVVYGTNILPNGQFDKTEWQDAVVAEADDKLLLHFKQDSSYLYIGIEFADTMHTGIDLYLAESSDKRKMLHVSSAIGESEYSSNEWLDINWGGNEYWIANSIGSIYVDGKKEVVPLEGFEFQIDKSMFEKDEWYMMIHLKRPEYFYPESATTESIEQWIKILM
ncbi:MAG: hypothetical protein GY839_03580 [candidate division Zixibacteria bacterium]|nr:hypothetical protein [candidate division Zixibacteria bacterium]